MDAFDYVNQQVAILRERIEALEALQVPAFEAAAMNAESPE